MLLPAVQQVREAARRTTCMNNSRQLALASLNFESTHGEFPSGWDGWNSGSFLKAYTPFTWRGGTPYQGNFWGWGAFILPFMEQNNLYDQCNLYTNWGEDMLLPSGDHLSGQVLPTFICPSDNSQSGDLNTIYTSNPTNAPNGKSNYVGNSGFKGWNAHRLDPSFSHHWGPFGMNTKVKFAEIRDGSSNTILYGERSSEPETGVGPRDIRGAIWIGCFRYRNNPNLSVPQPDRYSNIGRTDNGINYVVNGHYRARNLVSSSHPGGGTASFCDGSAHFLSDNLANTILRNLSAMADGNVVNGY
jgi:prepilin-type processing-associated H-X9-DG protein